VIDRTIIKFGESKQSDRNGLDKEDYMKQKMSFFLAVFLGVALLVVLPLSANAPVWAQDGELIEGSVAPEEMVPVERTVEQMLADTEALALAGVESHCAEVPILPGVDKGLKSAALSGKSPREDFLDAQPLAPPTLTTQWAGLNQSQAGDCGSTWRPPDTMVAAGLGGVATVYNVHFAVHRASNQNLLLSVPMSAFLGYTATCTFDPQVMLDKVWRKWIVAIEARPNSTTSQFQFWAVSRGQTPLGSYWIYAYNTRLITGGTTTAITWDYPKLGMDADAVLTTANVFNVGAPGDRLAWLISLPKSRLYNGLTTPVIWWGELKWTLVPPVVWDTNANTYLIAAPRPDVETPNKVYKYTLTNSSRRPGAALSGPVAITVPTYAFPPNASQPGTTATLDTLDSRFTHYSTQIGDSLYNVHTIGPSLPTPIYYIFDTEGTNANTIKERGAFFASSSSHDWMAGIMANTQQDIFVVWSSTNAGAGINAQMRISGKEVGDATTSLGPGTLVYQSPTFYTQGRWGDYQNVDVAGGFDWGNQDVAFAFAEVIVNTSTWGTRIARMVH
jgi:hypothetical protein